MSTHAKLQAEKRTDHGKGAARRLRAEGRVPAVMYGKDEEAMSLSVSAREAQHLFESISVENTIVDVKVGSRGGSVATLVREVQVHPYRPQLVHIDFYRIQKDVAVEVEIPVHLEGVPEGVKTQGGVLEQIVHELPVKCLPEEMPQAFTLDVSALEIGDALHVSDIEIPEGVEAMVDLDRTVCTVVTPRVIEVEEEEEEEEVEVLTAAGEEAEGEAGEGAAEAPGTEAGEED